MDGVILKLNKEKPIKNRHHWIFSGAVLSLPKFNDGDILPVYSSNKEFLGQAYFNRKSNIIGRMVAFDDRPIAKVLEDNLNNAIELRNQLLNTKETNAYRLINAEGDLMPGLIVDKYNDALVIQIGTLGMEKLKPMLLNLLNKKLKPSLIYEKSNLPSRQEEGMAKFEGLLSGKLKPSIKIKENGLNFLVELAESQKTGFFLDQRQMRELAGLLSADKKVLNCFSYTGAFSVYAATNKAKQVDSVEISAKAQNLAKENFKLNGFKLPNKKYNFYDQDVFEFLRHNKEIYDFIILDPPAFAKRKNDIDQACRGYKEINRLAIKMISSPGLLLTSSCSYHIDEQLFQKVIFQAAKDAGRNARIIQKHHLAYDHPINIYHPEGSYLKSLLLFID